MPITVQEYIAKITENAAQKLAKAAEATPADRQDWKPLERGRTAIHQIAECAFINKMAISIIQEQTANFGSREERQAMYAALDTTEKVLAELEKNTAGLVSALRSLPDEALSLPVELPWGTQPVSECIILPYWNMTYHEGQINYIQTLCAEAEA